MKIVQPIYAGLVFILIPCGAANSLKRYPTEDRNVYEAISKLTQKGNDESSQKSFTSFYAEAVLLHQNKITAYRNSEQPDRWEKSMNEYAYLNKLADAVNASPVASKLVKTNRYDEQYAEAKQRAAEAYYDRATTLLTQNDRDASREAYDLLKRTNELAPGYKDSRKLMDIAYNQSVLTVVVNPVNYYAQSYGYWGLNNDYVQQEIVRDLRYQLGTSTVKFFTDWEARSNRINPDRVVDISWDELFIPIPNTYTSTREVSRRIQSG